MFILNVAAGTMKPILGNIDEPCFIVNLDKMYYQAVQVGSIEYEMRQIKVNPARLPSNQEVFVNADVFEFLGRFAEEFVHITVYRFLEHVPFDQVLFFIYQLSGVIKKGGLVDVIVPNYHTLAKLLLEEDVNSPQFEADNIILTTEIVNEPSCPHASLWTPDRATKFFELEKRFKIGQMVPEYEFDGRAIYMRFLAERI